MFDRSSPFSGNAGSQPHLPEALAKADFAIQRLRTAILSCELRPGEQVSEQDLCDRFSLARAGTRSALANLAGEGLVEALPRRGWRVAPITPRLIRDLIAARRVVEPSLVRRTLPSDLIGRLDQLANIEEALVRQDDASAILTARHYDRQLLDALAEAGNLWTARWLAQAWDGSDRIICFLEQKSPARLQPVSRVRLVEALHRPDHSMAEAELLDALDRFEAFTIEALLSLRIDLSETADRQSNHREQERIVSRKDTPSATNTRSLRQNKGELEP